MRLDDQPTDPRILRDFANSEPVQADCRKLAKAIQKDARRLAPRNTGRLARGIVVEEITDLATGIEGFAVGWNDKAFYGWLVEEGTGDVPPRPHLVPAAIKNGVRGAGGQ